MSCSEGDSKPTLGEGPKVFMLALAKLVILICSCSESWPGVASAQARNYIFYYYYLGEDYFKPLLIFAW